MTKFYFVQPEKTVGHFYAASLAEWRVDKNPGALIAFFKREGDFSFTLWWVPVPIDAEYRIEGFAPQVEGAIQVAFYTTAKP